MAKHGTYSEIKRQLATMGAVGWLAVAASLCTIVGFLMQLGQGPDARAGWVFAVVVSLLLVVSWVLLALREFSYARSVRYAEALPKVHAAFHLLRDAWYSYHQAQDSAGTVHALVERSLSELAAAFSMVTASHCRVCIKFLYVADTGAGALQRKMAVRTYARSTSDPKDTAAASTDWLDENSDFQVLFANPQEKCFFRNRLPYPGYRNSHWTEDQMAEGKMDYAATIVWPIRKRLGGGGASISPDQEQDLLGFVCVDSRASHVYNERYDVDLGAGFADSLYSLLWPVFRPELADSGTATAAQEAADGSEAPRNQ